MDNHDCRKYDVEITEGTIYHIIYEAYHLVVRRTVMNIRSGNNSETVETQFPVSSNIKFLQTVGIEILSAHFVFSI